MLNNVKISLLNIKQFLEIKKQCHVFFEILMSHICKSLIIHFPSQKLVVPKYKQLCFLP